MAGANFELFLTEFTTKSDVQGIGGGPAEIGVEVGVGLLVQAGVKVARRVWTEARVHRVVDEEVCLVLAAIGTDVPTQVLTELAAQTDQEGHIGNVATKTRRESAGDGFLEAETVRVSLNLSKGICIGDVAIHCDNRAAHAIIRCEIADQQGCTAVTTVDRTAVGGVTEEETAIDFLAVVVSMAVQLEGIAEVNAKVRPQLHVVVDDRPAPDHGRHGYVLVTVVDQALCVSALLGTAGRVRFAPLCGQVEEAGLTEG